MRVYQLVVTWKESTHTRSRSSRHRIRLPLPCDMALTETQCILASCRHSSISHHPSVVVRRQSRAAVPEASRCRFDWSDTSAPGRENLTGELPRALYKPRQLRKPYQKPLSNLAVGTLSQRASGAAVPLLDQASAPYEHRSTASVRQHFDHFGNGFACICLSLSLCRSRTLWHAGQSNATDLHVFGQRAVFGAYNAFTAPAAFCSSPVGSPESLSLTITPFGGLGESFVIPTLANTKLFT